MGRIEQAMYELWRRVRRRPLPESSTEPSPEADLLRFEGSVSRRQPIYLYDEVPEWQYVMGHQYKGRATVYPDVEDDDWRKSSAPALVRALTRDDPETGKRVDLLLKNVNHEMRKRNYGFGESLGGVEYVASLVGSGNVKSAEAIAVASALYIFSGGKVGDKKFLRDTKNMAEAIQSDDLEVTTSADLGLSQALRLRHFSKTPGSIDPHIVSASRYLAGEAPTVGGEFHFSPDPLGWGEKTGKTLIEKNPSLLRRWAILNMAMYQRDSSVPFSGMYGEIPEMRMNPSVYPVAGYVREMMEKIVPEIAGTYFNISVGNFKGDYSQKDEDLMRRLQLLGNICYAAYYKSVPDPERPSRVKKRLGDAWFGQTVQREGDTSMLIGLSSDNRGQMNFFAGQGAMYPDLAYYFSMVAMKPALMDSNSDLLGHIDSPSSAIGLLSEGDITDRLIRVNEGIEKDRNLMQLTRHAEIISQGLRSGRS